MSNPKGEGASFRPDIQGLRALAVLFVVFYHARFPFFSGGYIGVDVFFVISGYLISGLLVREVERNGRIDLLRFYARRMRRLLPAAAVVLVATVVAARLWLSPLEQIELAPSVLFSALYASNLLFAFKATDYLAGDVHSNLLLHTWSLSVEEQFYLMWPAVILLGAYLAMRMRGRSSAPIRAGALVSMASVCVLSLGLALWVMRVSQPWAFFGSPMRAWEFAAGGLAFMVTPYVARWSDRVKDALVALGFAVTVAAVLFFDDRTPFPGLAALVPVVGTVLMIVAGTGRGLMTWWLGTPVMQTIGNVSYSWYLWHWPVLLLFPLIGSLRGVGARVAGLVVSFLLAWATYHLVENRVRFSPLLAPSPMRSIVLGVCLTVIGTGSALALRSMAKVALASPEQAKYIHVRDDLPSIYRDGCHQSVRKEAVPGCVYGDPAGRQTVVVFGDSHAAQWFPAFDRIARENGWKLISLTKSACPSVWVTPYRPELGRRYDECERWRAMAAQRIAQERPALVVLANSSDHVQIARREVNGKASRGIEAEQWRDGMRDTLAKLGRSAGSIVILRDTPFPGFDVPTCLSKAAWRGENALAACSFDRRQALNGNVFELERQAAEGLANVSVIDLSDLLCTSSTCAPLLAGGLAYRDDHHLTVRASRGLASALLERLGSRFTH